jgi:MerR-like DNA binding protein
MPMEIRGQQFYKSSEVAGLAGVHRLTLLRWIREGRLSDVARDRNGWRVFSEQETAAIIDFAKSFDVRTSPNQRLLFPAETEQSVRLSAKL